jgi:hypothetical protein
VTYDEICREVTRTAEAWHSGNMPKEEAQYIIGELNRMKRELFENVKEAV